MPVNMIIFRTFINQIFGQPITISLVSPLFIWMTIIGAIEYLLSFAAMVIFGIVSKRQLNRIKLLYFKAILRQDVPWFELQSSGALISQLSANIEQVYNGIGTKLAEFVLNVSGFVSGIIIAFIFGWKLSLVALAMLPLIAGSLAAFGFLMKNYTIMELKAYASAGKVAGEVLSAIKTVIAFGGEDVEVRRYGQMLKPAEKVGIKKSTAIGGVTGALMFAIYGACALLFWYGIRLIRTENYEPGTVILVVINVVLGSFFLGNALPTIPYVIGALGAARIIYGTIDHVPEIDKDAAGIILPRVEGNIMFRNVSFVYPTRPDNLVLDRFNLRVRSGETIALVGPSGSGKSTIVQLLMRFYDPVGGDVIIEGEDIRDVDLKDLRSRIGIVSQEPILFDGSVRDNIALGRLDATDREIVEAARLANAHDFIMCDLPEGYDTWIGERGAGLSGGQKQRIAIARALIKQPRLLLLDEATSALDTRAEKIVQKALDSASRGRTVIMVAHRLTTVRNADRIIVLSHGVVREQGTHDELLAAGGIYANMLKTQGLTVESEASTEMDDMHDPISKPEEIYRSSSRDSESSPDLGSSASFFTRSMSTIKQAANRRISKFKQSTFGRIFHLNKPETKYIALGCVCAVFAGAAQPAFAVLYGRIYFLFTLFGQDGRLTRETNIVVILMAVVGVIRFLAELGQGYFYGVSGERLVLRVRTLFFAAIMRQEIGWFDEPDHQSGVLTAQLASDAPRVKTLSGNQLGIIIQSVVLVVGSVIIAFIFSWQLTLLFIIFYPAFVLNSGFQKSSVSGQVTDKSAAFGIRVAQETIAADKTVFALCLEKYFYEKFAATFKPLEKVQKRESLKFGAIFALSQAIPFWATACVFALGVYLIQEGQIDIADMFTTFIVLNLSAFALGRTASFGSESAEADRSSKLILSVLDRRSKIPRDEGDIPREPFSGNITFRNVYFRYPTRPEVRVLRNFSHSVRAGQTVAIVGQSGCGKSTVLQLVQRLYDPTNKGPDSGVFFDRYNIRHLAPCWVRSQLAIVSQEPNLFDMSIEDNIAYGDHSRNVPMEDIVAAAREANIHDFIMTQSEGYNTMAGERGSKLSGGQKQRIAIARALVRRPKLLILDEATSALDNESERIVQAALDAVVGSRTSLVVAHRLTTVQNADQIVVLEKGHCVESGRPAELLAAKGAFHALHNTAAAM